MAIRKVGNIYEGTTGLRKVGNIYDSAGNDKKKRLEEAQARAEAARLEAERLNSFSGLAGETVKGILGMGKELGKEIVGTTAAVGVDVGNVLTPWRKRTESVNLFGNDYITPSSRGARAGVLAREGKYKQAFGELGTAGLDVLTTFATPFNGAQIFKGGAATRGFIQGGTAAAPIVAGYGLAGSAIEDKSGLEMAKDTALAGLAGLAGGGILGAALAKVGARIAGNPRKDIGAFEVGQIVDEVDEKIGRATTPQEEEAIMELVSRGATREEIVESIPEAPKKQELPKAEVDNEDDTFLKSVEDRFKASKREKFREATKDEKGRFTGSRKGITGDAERDSLAESIQNRIDAIPDDSLESFSARLDLQEIQEKVARAKTEDLTKLKAESDRIAQEVIDRRAAKLRPTIDRERKIAAVREIARESDSFTTFQISLKQRGEEITKLFKSKPAAEEFYQKASGTRYRVADEDPLLSEARKYKSAEEFVRAQQPAKVKFTSAKQKADYIGGHEAPMAEDINNPIWDLNGKYTGSKLYPDDIYSADARRLYSSGSEADPQAISILQSVKGRPNAKVTVYRAVPKDVPSELNAGDWVTLTKEYAKEHGESNLGNNFKIVKKEVFARDIFTDANSVQEFGYDPQPRLKPQEIPYDLMKEGNKTYYAQYKSQLTDLWKKANQGKYRADEAIPKSLVDNTESGYQVRSEMELATAGSREIIGDGMDREVLAIPSTFPKWVSPEYRSRELFDKVLKHIDDGTVPKSSRQLGLYNEVREEMIRRANRFGERFEELTGKKITPEQEAKIKALHKKLFGDEDVEITAQILTPSGQKALGEYRAKVIKILDGQADPTDTFYHEAVHKYLDLFTTLDEQKKIYLEARKLWKTDNLDDLEEKIAENFIRYAKENEGVVGTMKVLFDKVIDRIKAALKGESQIEALYKDILEGKATKKKEVFGEMGVSKVAQSVEAKSIEKGLTDGFDGLAGYTKITIKDQAEKMSKLMSEDMERAKSLLDGGELPDGIRGETVIKAMEDYAMKTGDAELALRVANSPLTSETSAHAQAMRLLAERNPDSVVAKIQEVKRERQKRFESKGKKLSEAKKEAVADIKKKIKQPVPTEKDWEAFIESIKC